MTKIININKSYQSRTIEDYTAAAWIFALLALWPFEKIKKEKAKRCQSYIKEYLLSVPELKISFITFCEKILLVNCYHNCQSGHGSCILAIKINWLKR